MRRALLSLAALLIINSANFADVGPTRLETVINEANLVVMAKVIDVKTLDKGFKLAEIEVTETLRGETTNAKLHYIASPLTPEDVSAAQKGETALLFLRRLRKPPAEYPVDIKEITQGEAVFLVAAAGRGRLVPVKVDADNYVYFRRDRGILLPPKLSALWRQDANDPTLGLIRLDDLLDFIKQYHVQAGRRTAANSLNHNASKEAQQDIGKAITFSTLDAFGKKCAMVYAGPSLGVDGFLIQDCGGSAWNGKWNYGNGFIKRMSFPTERIGWFVIGGGLAKVERIDDTLEATISKKDEDGIESVFFVNEQYGWLCGDKGLIEKTEDGGVTWKQQVTPTDLRINKIRFINSLEGWATGGERRGEKFHGILLRTSDGGTKWSVIEAKETRHLSPVFFTSPNHGCGINDDNSIVCTQDGEKWVVTFADKEAKRKRDIFFLGDKEGWAAGDSIWHTSNGGETWQEQFTPPDQSQDFERIVFLNSRLGWAQRLDAVWRTSDGGRTWMKISDVWLSRLKDSRSDNNVSRFQIRDPKIAPPKR
jgi:photosystem II stability/assembly factor-like uncharacterized protein